jgi:acyl carrier protein
LPGPFPNPDTDLPDGAAPSVAARPPSPDTARVLAEVTEMITEVIGADELVGVVIGLATSFQDDLEVESIEFVVLSERLMARYGEDVDFVGWMAGMELDEIIALTVGDLVAFISAPS